ncbi:MAG: MotA/TolQ/ExbB proton channel family protein [Nitrospinota bacterium]|nr:MotA/TolQ/ExbB proton channel family protein [Nitrospinota bacterium]
MENALVAKSLSVVDMVISSGLMAKGVLLLLLIFSMVSWAIILQKYFMYKKARREDGQLLAMFAKSEHLTNIYNFSKKLTASPVARIFLTGYRELYLFQEMSRKRKNEKGENLSPSKESITARDLKGVGLSLNKAINREIGRLSKRLDFLATTGSTTPFIGLFGTVWGVMHSFSAIGVQGTASIGGVAPGIAEALIATAAGLFAAIPAVIFFNYLNDKIGVFTSVMEDFAQDFLFMAERNFLAEEAEKFRSPDLSRKPV